MTISDWTNLWETCRQKGKYDLIATCNIVFIIQFREASKGFTYLARWFLYFQTLLFSKQHSHPLEYITVIWIINILGRYINIKIHTHWTLFYEIMTNEYWPIRGFKTFQGRYIWFKDWFWNKRHLEACTNFVSYHWVLLLNERPNAIKQNFSL